MGATGDLPRWGKLPHIPNHPETRFDQGCMAYKPTLCIRLVSGYFRQIYFRLPPPTESLQSGSKRIGLWFTSANLLPPLTSAYVRRRKPPKAEVSGSRFVVTSAIWRK